MNFAQIFFSYSQHQKMKKKPFYFTFKKFINSPQHRFHFSHFEHHKLAVLPFVCRTFGSKKGIEPHENMTPAATANVDEQNSSSVAPTIFVPSTDPIRPQLFVKLIAMPLEMSKYYANCYTLHTQHATRAKSCGERFHVIN